MGTEPSATSRTSLIIPALDEEGAIGAVVAGFVALRDPAGAPALDEVVVADNGSRDRTAEVARAAGATVVEERRRGYGSACLRGLRHLAERAAGPPAIVVFADGDGSNAPGDLATLIAPLRSGVVDLVIGARVRPADRGALTFPQRFGNQLATGLIRSIYGARFSDLGPYRAVTWPALTRIGMVDPDYGWTVEMQVKAAKLGLRYTEVAVENRVRIAGRSKVAGTVRGVVGAGRKIIGTIIKYR